MDSHISSDAKSIVPSLLNTDQSKRFKANDIKKDRFFRNVDWIHIRNQKAPFIPSTKEATDTSYFDGILLLLDIILNL